MTSQEPIKIVGIIENEISEPSNDGTVGSGLYSVPFHLNRTPSYEWGELFERSWSKPPKFSSMHRANIASVSGDRIVLNGTTVEEVKRYHKQTLILCVEEVLESTLKRQQNVKLFSTESSCFLTTA